MWLSFWVKRHSTTSDCHLIRVKWRIRTCICGNAGMWECAIYAKVVVIVFICLANNLAYLTFFSYAFKHVGKAYIRNRANKIQRFNGFRSHAQSADTASSSGVGTCIFVFSTCYVFLYDVSHIFLWDIFFYFLCNEHYVIKGQSTIKAIER